jgi:DNA-binding transcriptional ArsR family regulator
MTNKENCGDIEYLARVFKAFGDTSRMSIVMAIGKESRSVTELVRVTGLSQTLISFHLRIMREADIVQTVRNGPFIYYSLTDPALLDILAHLSRKNGKHSDKGNLLEHGHEEKSKPLKLRMQSREKMDRRR